MLAFPSPRARDQSCASAPVCPAVGRMGLLLSLAVGRRRSMRRCPVLVVVVGVTWRAGMRRPSVCVQPTCTPRTPHARLRLPVRRATVRRQSTVRPVQ